VSDTRDRIITATSELFRRHGYNGTSMKAVTNAAGVPFGSLYHFFPSGKEELAETVIRTSGGAYRELFEVIWADAADPSSAITDFFEGAAAVLAESDYVDACPIGTVALEVASSNDRLRQATHDVFTSWVDAATRRFGQAGIAPDRSGDLAITFVAAIEGGFMLSRAARRPDPMRTTGRHVRELLAPALPPGDRTTQRSGRHG
jgi:AcrR family transcriptional regulator